MNSRSTLALRVCLLAVAVASNPLSAQVVAPSTSNSPPDNAEKVVVLSPFVVESTKDTGYQATSTLAGTRLNTPLIDLGASISVFTKQFLEDVGATTATELLVYATGMDAAGPAGNYSGAITDINATEVVGGNTLRDNSQTSRTRGLAAPSFTRGYFATSIAVNSYNTETVTVVRGPNSMLFGAGSPAGVVDQTLLRPDLNRNSNKVGVRYGNNNSWRETLDINRVLIPKKLAVRLAAVADDNQYNQRPAFENTKRVYGALVYAPYKSTELRANFEAGSTKSKRPITVLPVNNISDAWYAAGRPVFDWKFYDDPARNPNASTQNSGSYIGNLFGSNTVYDQIVVVYNNSSDSAPTTAFRMNTPNTTGSVANAILRQLYNPVMNQDLADDSTYFFGTKSGSDLPGAYWVGANVLPGQQPGVPPVGIKRQGFTDFSAFDFRNQMFDESSQESNSFHAANIAFEQRGWEDRIGIEVAYNAERFDRRSKADFFAHNLANAIYIDVNATLPTGEPNPNLGRPFVVGRDIWPVSFTERQAKRFSGYLKYDFKDLNADWGKWLGRHTLSAVYENSATDNINYLTKLQLDGDAPRAVNANIGVEARALRAVVYVGPSLIGNNNPLQLEAIRIPTFSAGPTVPATYFKRAANLIDPGAMVSAPMTIVERNYGGSASREVIKSQSAVLQSYWLMDHLITTAGWRRDEDYFMRQSWPIYIDPTNTNAIGKVQYGFEDFSLLGTPPPNASKEIISYSAVLRWPRKLLKLPAGTDVNVFYNEAENFTPLGGRVNAYAQPLPSPQGQTQEFGFNFAALKDKLNLRVNWFETSVQGQSVSTSVYTQATNFNIFAIAGGWATDANSNPHLAALRQSQIDLMFSVLPANYRDLYNFKILGTAPTLSFVRGNISGITDTTDFTAKGTELEITYNPTRNWRILANVAKQETVKSNSFPFLKQFIAMMKPVWDQLKDVPRDHYPDGWQVGDPITYTRFGDWLEADVMIPFATATATEGTASPEQRKWRANFITNYDFGSDSFLGEKLKGFGLGGAVRWQDKIGIGYPTSRDPNGTAHIDIEHPYYAPAETNIDAWVTYQRKLARGKIDWRVQLNVSNLFGSTDPIAITAQPWGAIANVRLAPERRWYLSNTFSF